MLIDEYDKPLADSLNDPDLNQRFHIVLRICYGMLKSVDRCLRFVFITSVTRLSEVSLLSSFNQLRDSSYQLPQMYCDRSP
ncbi:MAG: AAA family ATPase [Treponema sp.]|nr:AAA family ATPase [Treponema sp.]